MSRIRQTTYGKHAKNVQRYDIISKQTKEISFRDFFSTLRADTAPDTSAEHNQSIGYARLIKKEQKGVYRAALRRAEMVAMMKPRKVL